MSSDMPQWTHTRLLRVRSILVAVLFVLWAAVAVAAGGPLGIDHRLSYDNSGIWKRSNQKLLLGLMVGTEVVGGLWEGGQTRLGRTFWQSIDASAIAAVSSQALKYAFTRARPSQTDNPNLWFQGGSHYSFPSGEVATVSAIVTPFVLEYRRDTPAVYALELLPLYDAVARVKVRGHWQSDVVASLALGTLAGYYAHLRKSPIILSVLPHGFFVGLREQW
ncbi:MAG: phosphatase PAP2 family protein [Gammaproteobacteria bacterium]